jgi:phospholipid/cholesterol/gamma-HCH transport system ATP-binding protein
MVIKLVDVHKSFGDNYVLRGVNLEVMEGESVVVIGGSGSGKTVLIKHIIGLIKPDKGELYVDGLRIDKMREKSLDELRKKFGMLFQGAALFDSLTVFENVAFGLRRHIDLTEEEIRDRVRECLRMVGMPRVEHLYPAELSGGMKKRVGLARAIAMNPKIILYDEPTTGLDPIMADVINSLIISLKQKLKVTSVAITHDMVSAYKIADRIAMLYDGRIIEEGNPEAIRNSSDPVVQQFINGRAEGPINSLE